MCSDFSQILLLINSIGYSVEVYDADKFNFFSTYENMSTRFIQIPKGFLIFFHKLFYCGFKISLSDSSVET